MTTETAGKTVTVPLGALGAVLDACTRALPNYAQPQDAIEQLSQAWQAANQRAFLAILSPGEDGEDGKDGERPGEPDGEWLCIAFMGHNEYTGYVTEIVRNGQPAYRIDLPEKIWGGNPLEFVEYAASTWFSDRPVKEEFVHKAWEAQRRRTEERRRQEAEWARMQEQRAITGGSDDYDRDSSEPTF